jgi:light-regulated signal transduction histidine kinase (bacteriophytochrome)
LEKYIKDNNGEVKTDILGKAEGDFYQIVSVFQNLISNGIKYNNSDKPEIIYRQKEQMVLLNAV